jgi:23S rRNA (cytidine2498-2'-O)-methyltransferase
MKRKMYSKFKWLTADANVAPNYILEVVEDIVNYPTSRFQGLLLTFKLSSYELIDQVDVAAEQIRSWGFSKVKVRQLASNRRECCIAAQR